MNKLIYLLYAQKIILKRNVDTNSRLKVINVFISVLFSLCNLPSCYFPRAIHYFISFIYLDGFLHKLTCTVPHFDGTRLILEIDASTQDKAIGLVSHVPSWLDMSHTPGMVETWIYLTTGAYDLNVFLKGSKPCICYDNVVINQGQLWEELSTAIMNS